MLSEYPLNYYFCQPFGGLAQLVPNLFGTLAWYARDSQNYSLKNIVFYTYILYSAKVNKYYVGQTDDIDNRLRSHHSGISPYTKIANDWQLVYSESYQTRKEAIQRENEIKRKKSRLYIERLIAKV